MLCIGFRLFWGLERLLFSASSRIVKLLSVIILLGLLEMHAKEETVTANIQARRVGTIMSDFKQYSGLIGLNAGHRLPAEREYGGSLHGYRDIIGVDGRSKGQNELDQLTLNGTGAHLLRDRYDTIQMVSNDGVRISSVFGRKMADYELVHGDQIVFRPIGYHEFDVIPQIIHQIPENQYQMFRGGYLGYPYNPIDYYRSPYITAVKKNRTRRLMGDELASDTDRGYGTEYEIMEFINGNNNSLFSQ
ncbi:hypothetical protein OJ253_1905 [Cryptosporidium canis]|uniref:Uncharacterized protein n=1 Tax=Cryptosporidium canis TaxID=195482 RepID=A0A9D5HX53_9CRYT|nr:hypothetical protein OJ253_1905 [Cryptosporidium canis]